MAISLNGIKVSARTLKRGEDNFVLPAGKTLKIETTPAGEEILQAEVPTGKKWAVSIIVNIVETDA